MRVVGQRKHSPCILQLPIQGYVGMCEGGCAGKYSLLNGNIYIHSHLDTFVQIPRWCAGEHMINCLKFANNPHENVTNYCTILRFFVET